MHIKEIPNAKTKLRVPQTTRNKVISQDIPSPLPKTNFTALIVGAPNSGKSVLCESLLRAQLYKMYDNVIVVSPVTSRDCFKGSVLKQVADKKKFHSLTDENLDEIEELIVKTRDEGKEEGEYWSSLIYLDDIQNEYKSSPRIEKAVRGWLANYRHLHLTVLLTLQNLVAISKASRELFRCVFLFKTTSRKELIRIHDEFLGSFKHDEAQDLLRYVFDKKHNFLFIDRQENIFAKNFNVLQLRLGEDGLETNIESEDED